MIPFTAPLTTPEVARNLTRWLAEWYHVVLAQGSDILGADDQPLEGADLKRVSDAIDEVVGELKRRGRA